MGDTLRSPFVQAARGRGSPARRVVGVHALRPALTPVVTFVAADVGLIVVEGLCGMPGIGNAILGAIEGRDRALMAGLTTTDVAAAALDPQVHLQETSRGRGRQPVTRSGRSTSPDIMCIIGDVRAGLTTGQDTRPRRRRPSRSTLARAPRRGRRAGGRTPVSPAARRRAPAADRGACRRPASAELAPPASTHRPPPGPPAPSTGPSARRRARCRLACTSTPQVLDAADPAHLRPPVRRRHTPLRPRPTSPL
ncbi:hypothetical protein [Geodermatophilus maliterrae]|uniref:Uncharacterized protein n=1 Tax=Geodermatophilus maliterrae TaxID=3162531 RepID=A0ABV3XIR2_9ACTN